MKKRQYGVKERVSQYRARMEKAGMRQINIWVPDTRSPAFAKECRRQSLLAAKTDKDEGILDVLDELAKEIEGWTP